MATYFIRDNLTLKRALREWQEELSVRGVDETCLFHCRLVFSELASNALRHAGGNAKIEGLFFENRVEITAYSAGNLPPENSRCSSVYAESGRGLFLIDSVSARRENTTDGGVKVVVLREE